MNHIVSFTPSLLKPLKQAYEEAQRLHCKAEQAVQCAMYEMDNEDLQIVVKRNLAVAKIGLHYALRTYEKELDKQL
jgi:hypothetical protein